MLATTTDPCLCAVRLTRLQRDVRSSGIAPFLSLKQICCIDIHAGSNRVYDDDDEELVPSINTSRLDSPDEPLYLRALTIFSSRWLQWLDGGNELDVYNCPVLQLLDFFDAQTFRCVGEGAPDPYYPSSTAWGVVPVNMWYLLQTVEIEGCTFLGSLFRSILLSSCMPERIVLSLLTSATTPKHVRAIDRLASEYVARSSYPFGVEGRNVFEMDEIDAELVIQVNFPIEARLLLGCLRKGFGRALASTMNVDAEVQKRLDRIQIVVRSAE